MVVQRKRQRGQFILFANIHVPDDVVPSLYVGKMIRNIVPDCTRNMFHWLYGHSSNMYSDFPEQWVIAGHCHPPSRSYVFLGLEI